MAKCSDETHLIRDSIRSSLNESKPEVTSNVGTEAESGADKGCQCRHPYLIEPALLLYTISRLGLVTIASEFLKDYLLEKYLANCGMPVCNNNYTTAIENQVQSEAAKWVLYLNLSRNLPAIFATIIIVPCTDRIGRKPGIALPALGAAVYTLMYVLVSYLKLPLEFLFLGAILEGLTGSYNAVSGSCYAYVADVIHGEKRTWRFTVISMLLNASSGVFNILLGFLVESLGFQSTFLTILGLLLLDVVYITAIVPESRRRKNNISINNIMKSIKNCLKIYRQKREDPTARGQLILLIPALAICSISFLGRLEVDTLYVIGPPLSFDATLVGIFVGVRALSTSMGGLILTRVRQPFMGDAAIGLVSVVSAIASNVCFALAKTETFVWISVGLGVDSFTVVPMIYGMLSKNITADEQGALMATISVLEAICGLISSVLLTAIHAATTTIFPGLVFLFIAALYGITGLILGIVWCLRRRSKYMMGGGKCEYTGVD